MTDSEKIIVLRATLQEIRNMRDKELVGILRISDAPCDLHAANRIEALRSALGSMLESYGMSIGEVVGVNSPLPEVARDVVRGFFKDAKRCNEVFHAE
jgi:hypothetical protein